MRVAYCSLLLPEEKRLSERSRERLSGISGHKVTWAEIQGIDSNNDRPVDIFNIINTLNYPKFPQLVFPREEWNHTGEPGHVDLHLWYVNLFGIKYITQYRSMKSELDAWVRKSDEKGIICVHHIYLPAMLAAVKIREKYPDKVRLCLNTGDIPGTHGLQSQYRRNLKQVLTDKLVNERILALARQFDCFVFVTEDMAEAFGVGDKPYTVVECTYTYTNPPESYVVREGERKKIFYAGSIREEYGIGHLLRAFSLIGDPDYRLVIAGGGAGEDLVREYAASDKRIEFLGFITPQQVLKEQLESHVLVSPRQSDHDFVRYSFPSKSLDCLATGVPYVAHRLPCDPPEYARYINYPNGESDEDLKNKLVEICEMSESERRAIGEQAKRFIIEKKNSTVMTERIVRMWKEEVGDKQ